MYTSDKISTIKEGEKDITEAEKNPIIGDAEKPKNINLNDDVDDENSVTKKNTNKADNNEKNKNSNNDVTIIVGSTNFFFNFKNTKETIPVLLIFHK